MFYTENISALQGCIQRIWYYINRWVKGVFFLSKQIKTWNVIDPSDLSSTATIQPMLV